MKKFTLKEVYMIMKDMKINPNKVDTRQFRYGINEELKEHENILNNRLDAVKIALSHIEQIPSYYKLLKKLEKNYHKKNAPINIYV